MEAYKNPALTPEERARDLLSRMTLEEKIAQINIVRGTNFHEDSDRTDCCTVEPDDTFMEDRYAEYVGTNGIGYIHDIYSEPFIKNRMQRYLVEKTRLGIPAIFTAEALHGLAFHGASIFPVPLTLSQTFKADGTFETFIDEDDLEAYFDAIKALIRDGLVAYFEDMLVQSALDMTVDELLALSGTDMDTMLDETFAAMDFDSMADAFKASGKYALEDGKMYGTASNGSINKNVYETYTLTEDTLTLHAVFGQAADGVTYPMVFTRVTE